MAITKQFKKIGVVTTGGDCPGLNAAIRAVVRTAAYHNTEVVGIMQGYEGMIKGDFMPLGSHSVSNILQRGGTILKTARSEGFKTAEGRKSAYENLKKAGIEALVVIGGDGSFKGIEQFSREFPMTSIGIPKTIDNDIYGTDYAIGFDTALNTVIQVIDKIKIGRAHV